MSKQQEMAAITKLVATCTRCQLCKTRKNVVVGSGLLESTILFIGEAPGYHEDMQGKPFVGKARKVLDA